jgi:hypothetical protein
MYLVHAELRAPSPGGELPPDAARLLLAAALPAERIEHVVVHGRGGPAPVLGVYVLADRLEAAEAAVAALLRRAPDTVPGLHGWTSARVAAPLVAAYYERLLAEPGPAPPLP